MLNVEKIDRPRFREYTLEELVEGKSPEKYDLVQLKMDGIWGCMTMKDGEYTITSRTGKVKADGFYEYGGISSDAVILGEFMKGSHWGHKMGYDGMFFAFDCLKVGGKDIAHLPLIDRLQALADVRMPDFCEILEMWSSEMWDVLWYNEVIEKHYEGLVFKQSTASYDTPKAWSRLKNTVEIEYMCLGMEPADPESKYAGLAGAVIGTLVDRPLAVKCGGLSEDMRHEFTEHPERYTGQVFTAKGNGWYPSGTIRHPKFKCWRDDKEVEECTYDQVPEIIRES
tara:strand:+ start:3191 stop:4039 length:849 start_codon:yes stop_codon:yes gene_type:complete